jgi:hypothetical protein
MRRGDTPSYIPLVAEAPYVRVCLGSLVAQPIILKRNLTVL